MSHEELSNAWIAYCEGRLRRPLDTTRPIAIAPWRGVELLWRFNALFSDRDEMLKTVEFSEAFDPQADAALLGLAKNDDLGAWDSLSAGAWRVLRERHVYAMTVMTANAVANNPVISHLPEGLTEEGQARALWLQFLLGGARNIDRRLLPKAMPGHLPKFPGEGQLKPH